MIPFSFIGPAPQQPAPAVVATTLAPGGTRVLTFQTKSQGVPTNADATPTYTIFRNGSAVTVSPTPVLTNPSTGQYLLTYTLPSDFVAGDQIVEQVTVTVGGAGGSISRAYVVDALVASRLAPSIPGQLLTLNTSGQVSASNGGGGGGSGTGDTPVNQDTGGTDNLRLEVLGVGLDGATVLAYLTTDYSAGNIGTIYVLGQTVTGPVGGVSGRWPNPIYLDAGPAGSPNSYTIVFSKTGVLQAVSKQVSV